MTRNSDEKIHRDGMRKLQQTLTKMLQENPNVATAFAPFHQHTANPETTSFLKAQHAIHLVFLPRRDYIKACILAHKPLGFVSHEDLHRKAKGVEQWISGIVKNFRDTKVAPDLIIPKRHGQRCVSRKRCVVIAESEKGFGVYEVLEELNILRKDLAINTAAMA